MKSSNIKNLTRAALIAAIYVVLCIVFRPISFGALQVRIAEALCILPYFTPAAVPGLAAGCLLANVIGGADIFDIIFGTLATALGAVGSYLLRRRKWLVPLPPIIFNTAIIPFVLRYAYGTEETLIFLMGTVGAGEVLACGVLGMILLTLLYPYREKIFRNT